MKKIEKLEKNNFEKKKREKLAKKKKEKSTVDYCNSQCFVWGEH
jgi:hypothetical protein